MPAGGEGKDRAPGPGKWRSLAGKEARYLAGSLGTGFVGGFLVAFVAAFLSCLFTLWPKYPDQRGMTALFAAGYAIYLGVIAGAVAGVALFTWRAVRAWILVPLIVVPAMLWLVLRLSAGFLEAQLDDVFTALGVASRGHEWIVGNLGHAAHIGPPILVIAMPLLLVDLGILALDPRVMWQLAILAAEVLAVLAVGTLPGALVSVAVLGVAYVRGFRRRHGSGRASA